jgi:hypothetical protein
MGLFVLLAAGISAACGDRKLDRIEHGWPWVFLVRADARGSLYWFSANQERQYTIRGGALAADGLLVLALAVSIAWWWEWRRRRRRFYQVTLRETAAVVTALAVLCGWMAMEYRDTQRQLEAEALLATPWFQSRFGDTFPTAWDHKFDGVGELVCSPDNRPRWFADLVALRVWSRKLSADAVDTAQAMHALESFTAEFCLVEAEFLHSLGRLPRLRSVELVRCDITDERLRHLAQIQTLESLDLSGNPITDRGLAHLHGLRNLKMIGLSNTQVTDEGVAALRRAIGELIVLDD